MEISFTRIDSHAARPNTLILCRSFSHLGRVAVQRRLQMESNDHDSEGIANETQYYGVGSSLKWDAQLSGVTFCVELPFWLLMPNSTLSVSSQGFETRVRIENRGVEIQRGRQFSRTRLNTVFIGNEGSASSHPMPMAALPEGGLCRSTRTLVYIDTHANSDAIDALFGEDNRRFQDGNRYFASLAAGHLPVLNEVINAYRRAAIDPHANEVTAWDVPTWFVCESNRTQPVCLYSHIVEDRYPATRNGENELPVTGATGDEVNRQLEIAATPGEIEMLDGWSLFYRGRYGDSIRCFVTAIEVALEAELRRLLTEMQETQTAIDAKLKSTRNNFDDRLIDYCIASKRRIPGPLLHWVPNLNGCRLVQELDRTRKLRHRIVHHGHRLDHTFSKPMLRAAETTSWLFNWLVSNADFEARRTRNHGLFFGWRTNSVTFPCEVRDGRIVALPPFDLANIQSAETDELLVVKGMDRVVHTDEILLRTIGPAAKSGKDVEHFVKMAFFELGMGELEDSPFEFPPQEFTERFRTSFRRETVQIFVLDTSMPVTVSHVTQVDVAWLDRAILVVNDQKDHDWHRRSTCPESNVDGQAISQNISVIRTSDLAKLVLGAMSYDWDKEAIVAELMRKGLQGAAPPSSTVAGSVYQFWEKLKVVGIIPSETDALRDGDIVAIKLRDRFHQEQIANPKCDKQGRVTFKISIDGADVPENTAVYRLSGTSFLSNVAETNDS